MALGRVVDHILRVWFCLLRWLTQRIVVSTRVGVGSSRLFSFLFIIMYLFVIGRTGCVRLFICRRIGGFTQFGQLRDVWIAVGGVLLLL